MNKSSQETKDLNSHKEQYTGPIGKFWPVFSPLGTSWKHAGADEMYNKKPKKKKTPRKPQRPRRSRWPMASKVPKKKGKRFRF